jgi:aspartate/methionine/tyrosine aminotransferase
MQTTQEATLHPLAEAANAAIQKDCPAVFGLLSALGRRFFFPVKGILAQGAEARQKAKVANATIGIATEQGAPMHLPCVHRHFSGLSASEIYDYAPSYGVAELRQAWGRKQREETPSLGQHPVSNPVVTNALTHGLSLVGELFLDPGDEALSSDLMWENYNLSWETRIGAHISCYPFFREGLAGFNLEGFKAALDARRGRKLVVSLNFPNNPSGYTPTRAEALGIVAALTAAAEAGGRLVVVCDDAYYGMFFDPECERESLFGRLAQAHPNLLAVKVDGATKEEFVWGVRVGFITFGVQNGTPAVYKALEDKTAGVIRAVVSNVTHPGQSVVLKALQDPAFRAEQAQKVAVLRARAEVTAKECRRPEYQDCWDVYPFNSGYFMCLRLKRAAAEAVRQRLLDAYGTGTIALGEANLRVAFSCLTEEQIPGVFKAIASAVRDLRG